MGMHELTMAPHMNFTITLKIGETVELKKPVPFTITLLKIEHDELHMKMEANGKTFMRKVLLNNFGLTVITTMEGEHLMEKAIYDRISPDITGYYEMDKEENLLLLLQQTFPDITVDILERMKLRGTGMTLKKDKDMIIIMDHFLEEEKNKMICKSKTTGKVKEREYIFTEKGFTIIAKLAGIKCTCFFKRCPDVE